MKVSSIKELKFDVNSPFLIQCFIFNDDEDRFCFTVGDYDSGDDDKYMCTFLDNEQAEKLIKFLTKNIKKCSPQE